MAITEQSRHELYTRLEEIMGRERATTLMEHLPPMGLADVATRRDLASLAERVEGSIDATRREIASLRERVDGSIDATRREIASLRDHVDHRFGMVEGSIDNLRQWAEIRFEPMATKAELHQELRNQMVWMVAAFCAISGLLVGAIKTF